MIVSLKKYFILNGISEVTGVPVGRIEFAAVEDLKLVKLHENTDKNNDQNEKLHKKPVLLGLFDKYVRLTAEIDLDLRSPPRVRSGAAITNIVGIHSSCVDQDNPSQNVKDLTNPKFSALYKKIKHNNDSYHLYIIDGIRLPEAHPAEKIDIIKYAIDFIYQKALPKHPPKNTPIDWRGFKFKVLEMSHSLESTKITEQNSACAKIHLINIQSGLLEFIRKIQNFNYYSYSVLPRETAETVFQDVVASNTAAFGSETFDLEVGSTRSIKGVQHRPILVTFGDVVVSDRRHNRAASESHVGWIIDPNAVPLSSNSAMRLTPVNRSVVAIVSVPAWWSTINVKISRAWLNENGDVTKYNDNVQTSDLGNTNSQHIVEVPVELPNRPEFIDSLLVENDSRVPVITGTDVQWADSKGDTVVLILGQRLWRNTAVTLGGEIADTIVVMPNMEGIKAAFKGVNMNQFDKEQSSTVQLRVWTSEGVAVVPIEKRASVRPNTPETVSPE